MIGKLLESIHADFEVVDKVTVTITNSGSHFLKAFREFSATFHDPAAESSIGNECQGDEEDEVRKLFLSMRVC